MKRTLTLILLCLIPLVISAQNKKDVALVYPSGHTKFAGRARKEIFKAFRGQAVNLHEFKMIEAMPDILEEYDTVLLMLTPEDLKAKNIQAILKTSREADQKTGQNAGRKTARVLVWRLTAVKGDVAGVDAVTSVTKKFPAQATLKKSILPFLLGSS